MDQVVIFFLASVLIIGALLFALIANSRKGAKHMDIERFRTKCLEIEHQLKRNDPVSAQITIINADKLLDEALRCRGVRGETMGERLKSAKTLLSDLDGTWKAHKLRNQIAHESDAKISYEQAAAALRSFRRALKDLGAI